MDDSQSNKPKKPYYKRSNKKTDSPANGEAKKETTAAGKSYGDRAAKPAAGKSYGDRAAKPAAGKSYGDRAAKSAAGKSYGDRAAKPAAGKSYGDRAAKPAAGKSYGDRTAKPSAGKSYGDRAAKPAAGKNYGDKPQGGKRPEGFQKTGGYQKSRQGTGKSGGDFAKKAPVQSVQQKPVKNTADKAPAPGGAVQQGADKAPRTRGGYNQNPRGAKPYNNKNGGRSGGANNNRRRGKMPREHDDYDDIRSYGGKYVEFPDYDEFDGEPIGGVKESFVADEAKKTDEAFEAEKSSAPGEGAVAGRNAVRELLRSERSVDKLFVKSGSREGSLVVIVAEAVSRHIPVVEVTQEKLDVLSGGTNHQGVVAMAAEKQYTDIDAILEIAKERGEKPLIVIADGIEDPHNLGALIRCAECAGAHGIVIPKRRSAGLTPVVSKASAGAIEHMAIAKVANISQTVEALKKKGLWIFASEAGGSAYYETDFNVPAAIIFGSEGEGVGKSIKEKCDFIVSIPMYGKVNSLNVSTAASVILCHAARMQRTGG